jgi:hypothetical protein
MRLNKCTGTLLTRADILTQSMILDAEDSDVMLPPWNSGGAF